ncbi:hypothetical protein L218DRAFT_844242, partial [Marasmius fiardii PR-910]
PSVLQASLEVQFQALVIEPLLEWRGQTHNTSASHSMMPPSILVIVGGLDECIQIHEQLQVLSLILLAMQNKLPLHFLICSQPEPQIWETFNQENLHQFTEFIPLNNSFNVDHDIEIVLHTRFNNLQDSEQYSQLTFPDPWPMQEDLKTLVDRSNGWFIYAGTLLKFID